MHRGGWMDDIHLLPRERCTDHISYKSKIFFLGNSYEWIQDSVWREIILGYLPTNIICSEKRMIFEERSFRKAVEYHWGNITGGISLGEYHWRNITGGISLGEYHWGNITGGISLGEYYWGNITGGISLGEYHFVHFCTSENTGFMTLYERKKPECFQSAFMKIFVFNYDTA